jgi:hypothetical protein
MNAVSLCAASTWQLLFSHLQRTMTSQASRDTWQRHSDITYGVEIELFTWHRPVSA